MLNNRYSSPDSGSHWIFIIVLLTGLVFFVNYISYVFEITESAVNLFLIPVIIATFLYQKKGMYYSIFVMVLYLVFVYFMAPVPAMIVDAGEDAVIMTGIALIITLLSIALHRSEKRYRLIFETSPAPLIVTDFKGEIVDINESFYTIFGYDRDLLSGRKLQELDFIHEESRDRISWFVTGFRRLNPPEEPVIVQIYDINNVLHTCRLFFSTLYDDDGAVDIRMIGILDITENVLAERRINLSLQEKEMLLREIHHRVKNNLQVIVSILRLQLNRTRDQETRETLRDCQNRVYSMAMVHEKIYRSDALARIEIKEYFEDLSRDILMGYSGKVGRIDISVSSEEDLCLDLDKIVPCALITNELLTNSLKYAFPENRKGHININFSAFKDSYTYLYKDDGIGIPAGFDLKTTETLGMRIVKSLVRQLKGDIRINSDDGTEIMIVFPIKS